jgi:hypothetical protein
MTLVAAFREQGIPFLLGDFLITVQGAEAGTRKKICRVTPNLAVAWTGHQIAAALVVNAMHKHFAGTRATKAELERFLTTFPTTDLAPFGLHLIGWILCTDAHCFRWNSGWPQEVFYAPHHYAGSGGPRFISLAGEGGSRGEVPEEHPARLVLDTVTRLMVDELGDQKNRAAGFGYAYEILFADGGEFVYVDDVTFVFAEVEFSVAGKYLRTILVPRFYRYISFGEMAIVQTQTLHSDAGTIRPQVDRNLITPPFDIPESEIQSLAARIVRPDFPLAPVGPRAYLLISPIRDADTPKGRPIAPLIVGQWPEDETTIFEIGFEPSSDQSAVDGTLQLRMPGRELLEHAFELALRDPDLSGS